MDIGKIIGRERAILASDIERNAGILSEAVKGARILIYGGAGSIGKAIAIEIFKRNPAALHVIDINENELVELVRDLRSSLGYIDGETRFLPIDMGSIEAKAFLESQRPYDYVLNLAAMKHVRSEKDAYSLMRMIKVNILDTRATLSAARSPETKKYFAVSTDKATNPVNLMGATKRIMEDVLFGCDMPAVSTARFANVAFSNGSLLHGFRRRIEREQPLSAPRDVRRYFVTSEEAGLLCLASLVLGQRNEVFFPKLDAISEVATFSDIAVRFLESCGYEAVVMPSEEAARKSIEDLIPRRKWPCYFFDSDTAGEKLCEEFYSEKDNVDWSRFLEIGIVHVAPLNAAISARVKTFMERVEMARIMVSGQKRILWTPFGWRAQSFVTRTRIDFSTRRCECG